MMRGNKEIQICHGLISRLPTEIVVEILVRISSVKTIAHCKSVCKSWHGLISDPRFAKLHLARSKICLLARNIGAEKALRTVYLLEDEDGRRGFHSGKYICRPGTKRESCEICRSDTTAITKLKIPVGPLWDIQNTCNGLLCLYSKYAEDSSIVVCNPVTCEFITLPDWDHNVKFRVCGLGLDPKTSRYKIVIMYSLTIPNSEELVVLKAVVHVLGTDSWRELDTPDVMLDSLTTCMTVPAMLNGALHWVWVYQSSGTYGMVSFDLESERLHYRSLPSLPFHDKPVVPIFSVAVLEGRLCVYPSYPDGKVDMCMIDERSVSDSLPEWISHDLSNVRGYLQLICSLDNGALLMYNSRPTNELIYYDPPRGSPRFKRMSFFERDSFKVVAYTPSFISLKNIVRPGNAEVLNVYSSKGGFRRLQLNGSFVKPRIEEVIHRVVQLLKISTEKAQGRETGIGQVDHNSLQGISSMISQQVIRLAQPQAMIVLMISVALKPRFKALFDKLTSIAPF